MGSMHAVFAQRRQHVLDAIGPNGVMVLPAAPLLIRNNDVEHEYRQDSDAYYLTGFDEPESVVVLGGTGERRFTMFVRPRDPEREVWDGARAGVDGATARFGAEAAHPIAELEDKLVELIANTERLYYRLGKNRDFDQLMLRAVERVRGRAKLGTCWPTQIIEPGTVIHEMRLYKSDEELSAMRRAIEISAGAHVQAMAKASPGVYEFEVEALLRAAFRAGGAERTAYEPIVGSGPNATVLHYRRNNRRIEDGDLLLIDAGCEYDYYASDITRTFPVSGQFSRAQREIYEIVLAAQLASIEATRPEATLEQVHLASLRVITEGLIRLGLIQGPLELALEEQRYKPYFLHKTSHFLGMDVHDVGSYFVQGKPRPLAAGMVITVEPGIYVAENATAAPAAYRGIGVRIEDDVLVTPAGSEVLSRAVPKFVADIERACAA
jgi:Xaa-Pro aminopeptidase